MGTGRLGRRAYRGRLFRTFAVFMLALILWLFVMLTLISADAGLLVDLSSRLKASYGFDFPGGGMGSLKLSIIGEALRDSGDGSAIALLKNPVPTATKSGGGANNSSKPTQDLERSNTNTPGSPTATGSSSSSLTPSPTATTNETAPGTTPSPTPDSTTDGEIHVTSSPTPSQVTNWELTWTPSTTQSLITPTATQTPKPPTATATKTPTKTSTPTKTPAPSHTFTPTPTYTIKPTSTYVSWPGPQPNFPDQQGSPEP